MDVKISLDSTSYKLYYVNYKIWPRLALYCSFWLLPLFSLPGVVSRISANERLIVLGVCALFLDGIPYGIQARKDDLKFPLGVARRAVRR